MNDSSKINPAKFKVEVEIPVRWADMDAISHVNNAKFFTYFEIARIIYCDKVGGWLKYGSADIGPILASTNCDFLLPLHYPCTVIVGAKVSKLGNTSMVMDYVIRLKDSQTIVATGSSVLVMYDYKKNKKTPIPDDVRKKIKGLEGI